ncbi:MAG: hypothetical protein AAF441_11655 [Pseudomonadota bacterium]
MVAAVATIGGVQVVTIPLSDYAELLEAQRELAEMRSVADLRKRRSRSPLDQDREVVAFLAERFGRMPVRCVLEQCRSVHGDKRTPSKSAAYRLWQRLRGGSQSGPLDKPPV